ncbi:MAG TPA: Asp23/Gls24 family envelope stress response protein [Gaiellaceae bacterium]|nr:Asp23/Gls24 family envelope stress response protein [Gaiellaceae bacterium]
MKTLAPGVQMTDSALSQVVVRAAESVSGARVLRPRRKVAVEIAGGRAHVDLELAVDYGLVLPDVAHEVQARVVDALRRMCEVDASVDVSIEKLEK